MRRHRFATLVSLLVLAMLAAALPAAAATRVDTSQLRSAVTLSGVRAHQAALQTIADANSGTRVAGSQGHADSAEYVYSQLAAAGYHPTLQYFDFPFFQELAAATLRQVAPNSTDYTVGDDFATMTYSPSGDVTASVVAVDPTIPSPGDTTDGCEAADFTDFPDGTIALIQRGTCTFAEKAQNAAAAGALGVLIFNEGNTPDRSGVLEGTLGAPGVTVPVVGISYDLGVTFLGLIDDGLTVRMTTDTISETRQTYNVIADTDGGRTDRIVLVGAHLDSVAEGPGINDDGSGTAVVLETALQLARLHLQPRNQVRFAFWSAEEEGLLGSQYYADQLTKKQIQNIAVMLDFDMLGSPNFVRFVYDGDGSSLGAEGPNGSGVVEQVFLDYFSAGGLATEPTAFDGRSDYAPFTALGIPAGGVFTGAEGIKTPEEAVIYGGVAGQQYDPCYHLACDTYDNNNDTALDQMSDATVHAIWTFAMTTSAVNGTDKGNANGQLEGDYLGTLLQR
jgi:Zn-dependent M28 family amino/carboxypeptidase